MFSCFNPGMDEPVALPLADLAGRLAWALRHHVWMLPHAPRKGPIKLNFEQCRTIAERLVAELERGGLVEVNRVLNCRPLGAGGLPVGAMGRIARVLIAMAMVVATLSGCGNWQSGYANYPPAVQGSNRGGQK